VCLGSNKIFLGSPEKNNYILPACNIGITELDSCGGQDAGNVTKKHLSADPILVYCPYHPKFTRGKRKKDQPTDEIKQDKCRIRNQG
jgi:hypothetical protein